MRKGLWMGREGGWGALQPVPPRSKFAEEPSAGQARFPGGYTMHLLFLEIQEINKLLAFL